MEAVMLHKLGVGVRNELIAKDEIVAAVAADPKRGALDFEAALSDSGGAHLERGVEVASHRLGRGQRGIAIRIPGGEAAGEVGE
jgi:hypothetical protein